MLLFSALVEIPQRPQGAMLLPYLYNSKKNWTLINPIKILFIFSRFHDNVDPKKKDDWRMAGAVYF